MQSTENQVSRLNHARLLYPLKIRLATTNIQAKVVEEFWIHVPCIARFPPFPRYYPPVLRTRKSAHRESDVSLTQSTLQTDQ